MRPPLPARAALERSARGRRHISGGHRGAPSSGAWRRSWRPTRGARLAPRLVRLLAAVALAVASARPPGDPANRRRRLVRGAPATMAATVGAVICVLMWRGTPLSLAPGTSEAPRILGDPAVSAVSLAAVGLFLIATLGFTGRGRPEIDPFLGWLASGCALSAVASLDYALYPATSLSLLHVGDFLGLAAAGAWMVGAGLEIKSHSDARAARAESMSGGHWPVTSTTGWPRTWRSSPATAAPAEAASTRRGGPSCRGGQAGSGGIPPGGVHPSGRACETRPRRRSDRGHGGLAARTGVEPRVDRGRSSACQNVMPWCRSSGRR